MHSLLTIELGSYMSKQTPIFKGCDFLEVLEQLARDGTLVDIILAAHPIDLELPKEIERRTYGVRIIHVGEDYIVVGPKKPLATAVIPLDEVSMVMISEKKYRDDEDELDIRIAELYADVDGSYEDSSGDV
jgi:hypothetical protein